jgi:hypothetical protein
MWFVRGAVAALVSPLGTALALGVLAGWLMVLARHRFWRRVGAVRRHQRHAWRCAALP